LALEHELPILLDPPSIIRNLFTVLALPNCGQRDTQNIEKHPILAKLRMSFPRVGWEFFSSLFKSEYETDCVTLLITVIETRRSLQQRILIIHIETFW